ncbi:MAG: hypothetical protein Q9184_001328 [Pyrenodesmia sp. 2 TL-2023]
MRFVARPWRRRQSGRPGCESKMKMETLHSSLLSSNNSSTPDDNHEEIDSTFWDGIEWMLKIPANGGAPYNERSARALEAEVFAMKLIYNNSDVPVPRIYSFCSTADNPLDCPFILMERIGGMSLFQRWYPIKTPANLEAIRERALIDIAKAMVQLNRFTFAKAGSLQHNEDGKTIEIGPYKKVDHFVAFDRMTSALHADEPTSYSHQGPFSSPRDYFLSSLDRREAMDTTKRSHTLRGQRKLLRLFVDWFFQVTSDSSGFVLAHPDFNLQNILVAKDGSLKGFIDWDGVVAVPRCIGCGEYPLWMTSDWDPNYWNYDSNEERIKDEDMPGMTPQQLDQYRATYAHAVDVALRDHDLISDRCQSDQTLQPSMTRVSPLARSLYVAANEPVSLPYNVGLILEKITDLTAGEDFEGPSSATDNDTERELHGDLDEDRDIGLSSLCNPLKAQETVETITTPALVGDVPLLGAQHDSESHQFLGVAGEVSGAEPNSQNLVEDIVLKNPLFENPPATILEKDANDDIEISVQQEPLFAMPLPQLGWWRYTSIFVSALSCRMMFIPAGFLVLMNALQSSDVSLITASIVGLLFSGSWLVSRLVELSLGGLFMVWLIGQSFPDRHVEKEEGTNVTEHHQEVVDGTKNGGLYSPESGRPESPAAELEPNTAFQTLSDGAPSEVATAAIEEIPFLSISTDHELTLENIELVSGEPRTLNHVDGKSSTSSDLRSSNSKASTPPTDLSIDVPSLNGDNHADDDDSDTTTSNASLTREEVFEMMQLKWDEDPTYDFGIFTPQNIYNALFKDELDEIRMRRMKVGFVRLLASLDERFEGFDPKQLMSS